MAAVTRPARIRERIPPALLGALLAALALALAPQIPYLPPWLSLFLAALGAWRLRLEIASQPLPGRVVLAAVTLASVAAVLAAHHFLPSLDAGLAVLALLTGLKLLELRSDRDRVLTVFLGYLLVLGDFLQNQSTSMAAYGVVSVLALTATLAAMAAAGEARRPRAHLRLAGALLTQAAPLTVALFVLFPRVAAPLWRLARADPGTAVSGLSDQLEPGSVSRLLVSGEVAFRVAFHGAAPPPALLYWRGPVFDQTDGTRWTATRRRAAPFPVTASGAESEYTVTLEPHGGPWLLALDLPLAAPESAFLTPGRSIRSLRPVAQRIRYEARSHLGAESRAPDPEGRALGLQVPEQVSRRVRDLALGWRSRARSDGGTVAAALRYFRQEPFVYTLRPPRLGNDPVDQFLFETRRGFCEHYAAAFALLMRAAGVPARVVTGYLGGEQNPLGDYWVVHQADAHAWAEVYLDGRGWVRVDPTAAVAPERVELGIDPGAAAQGAVRFRVPGAGTFADRLRQLRDSLDNGWNQWVLGYDLERQLALLAHLGLPSASWADLALWLAACTVLLLPLVWVQVARPRRARPDPVQAAYRDYCRRLARAGFARPPWEGPIAFRDRVVAARPDLAPAVDAVTALYAQLRFGRPAGGVPGPDALRELRRRVRSVRPRRQPRAGRATARSPW
ncbi:MAG: DUF3488 domain-containing transglutaminase family protein [Deltaproteobacteria bacterium]|nr:DUF3488 domain-containing transglutaminase family protein [Deltaproteobacteria bacterium]